MIYNRFTTVCIAYRQTSPHTGKYSFLLYCLPCRPTHTPTATPTANAAAEQIEATSPIPLRLPVGSPPGPASFSSRKRPTTSADQPSHVGAAYIVTVRLLSSWQGRLLAFSSADRDRTFRKRSRAPSLTVSCWNDRIHCVPAIHTALQPLPATDEGEGCVLYKYQHLCCGAMAHG